VLLLGMLVFMCVTVRDVSVCVLLLGMSVFMCVTVRDVSVYVCYC
jgi:hypothetical protein